MDKYVPKGDFTLITIRPYNKKDFRYVQDICMATSWLANDDNAINRAMLCAMYCDYYLDNQSEHCFVAVDETDTPIGYVLCAVDVDDYEEKMSQNYMQLVRKLSSKQYFEHNASQKIARRYVNAGYTAHLHIDILPDYHRQGIGTQLVQTLENHLKEMFVEGLHIVCSAKNQQARAFYEKMGFEDIDYIVGAVVYGKKFFTED